MNVDGPLLQRSSTVNTVPFTNQTVQLNITLAHEVPTFWDNSGWTTAKAHGLIPRFSYAFNETVPTGRNTTSSNGIWTLEPLSGEILSQFATLVRSKAPLEGVVRGCSSRCRASILAPALVPTCYSTEIPVDYTRYNMTNWDQQQQSISAAPKMQQDFWISVGLIEDQMEAVRLATGYYKPKGNTCTGTLNATSCILRSAGECFIGKRTNVS
jgi:hypothetical protein